MSDWRQVKDKNGETYYWNTVTNETSWTHPFPDQSDVPAAGTRVPPAGMHPQISGRKMHQKNDEIYSAPTMTQNQFVAILEKDDLDDMMATSHPITDLLRQFFSHAQRDGFIDINTLA